MLVTEGSASGKERRLYTAIAIILLAASVVLFAGAPALVAPVLCVSLVLGIGVAARDVVLSIVARGQEPERSPKAARQPSLAFVVPCLNEVASLKQSVPAMMNLRYEGSLAFCYVCERASTDGSIQHLRECAAKDPRLIVIEKATPPSGRGAAVKYGLARAPQCEVVGFLDADHVLDQESLDELAHTFGQENHPVAVQGRCATLGRSSSLLARLLITERQWLELVELQGSAQLGGVGYFGGGQGFLARALVDDPRFAIDESVILDDIDLSCRLALNDKRVVFNPHIATMSREPETLTQFLDQRLRWGRGWVQLAATHSVSALRSRHASLSVRADVVRLMLTPFAGACLFFGFAAAMTEAGIGRFRHAPAGLVLAALLWPFLLVPGPYLAGVRFKRVCDGALAAVGIPLLTYFYAWVMAVSLVDAYVLRRPVRYAKTLKNA